MNPWLKHFKEAKRIIKGSTVALFDRAEDGSRWIIPNTTKPLEEKVTWTQEELKGTRKVVGSIVFDKNGAELWSQERSYMAFVVLNIASVTFDFKSLTVGKWPLPQLLTKADDHC